MNEIKLQKQNEDQENNKLIAPNSCKNLFENN